MKTPTRKEEIIVVASQLFKEKGYTAISMRDIAKAMGMKAASLYNHISSKQEILSTLILRVAHEFINGMNQVTSQSFSPIQKITAVIELHIDITVNNSEAIAALNNDWMHLEAEIEYYMKHRKNYEIDFRGIIEERIQGSELINGNPEVMLFSLLSTLRSLYIWLPKKEDLDIEKFTTELSLVLINGINK